MGLALPLSTADGSVIAKESAATSKSSMSFVKNEAAFNELAMNIVSNKLGVYCTR